MSKGSAQRPTDKARFDANFDRIFGSITCLECNRVWPKGCQQAESVESQGFCICCQIEHEIDEVTKWPALFST